MAFLFGKFMLGIDFQGELVEEGFAGGSGDLLAAIPGVGDISADAAIERQVAGGDRRHD
jgi:hypothetical protein